MSNNDSIDEETKRILAEVDSDAQSGTNDSKESIKSKINDKDKDSPPRDIEPDKDTDDSKIVWEENTKDTPDSEW